MFLFCWVWILYYSDVSGVAAVLCGGEDDTRDRSSERRRGGALCVARGRSRTFQVVELLVIVSFGGGGGRQAGGATPLWVALELGFATGRVHFGAAHFESWTMGNAVGDRQPSTTLTMMTFRSICSALKALRKSNVKHWRHIHTQTHAAGATFRSKEPTEKKKTQRKRRRRES